MRKKTQRVPLDFYPTPSDVVAHALRRVHESITPVCPRILDPGCGDGVWAKRAKEIWPGAKIVGIDLVDRLSGNAAGIYDEHIVGDYLAYEPEEPFDLILCNPPFEHAEPFILRSIQLMAPEGRAIFLLRLSMLAAKKRRELWSVAAPEKVLVLSERPSFSANGRHDFHDVGVFHFRKLPCRKPTVGWLPELA